MFTIYSLYAHYMFTICSLYVHYMAKKLVAKIYHKRITGQFTRYQIQLVFPKEYAHYTFTISSLYIHNMFNIYSLYDHYMFTIYSSYVYHVFKKCSPYVDNMFTVCSLQKLVAKMYHKRPTGQFTRYQFQLVFPKENLVNILWNI